MPQTILVIDDQWSMQELARLVLHTAGYRVLFASDAITGLCLARAEHPDITVLDAHLSYDDGCDILGGLRQDPHTAEMPLILITTQPSDDKLPVSPIGAFARCLQKPFQPPELLTMVDGMLKHEMPIAS